MFLLLDWIREFIEQILHSSRWLESFGIDLKDKMLDKLHHWFEIWIEIQIKHFV